MSPTDESSGAEPRRLYADYTEPMLAGLVPGWDLASHGEDEGERRVLLRHKATGATCRVVEDKHRLGHAHQVSLKTDDHEIEDRSDWPNDAIEIAHNLMLAYHYGVQEDASPTQETLD